MPRYITDSYLYRAIGADIDGACGKCTQSRSDCMCHSLSRMDICGIIEDAPTADVPDRKVGKWVKRKYNSYQCSACACSAITEKALHRVSEFSDLPRYCPNCGAEMKGEDDGSLQSCV